MDDLGKRLEEQVRDEAARPPEEEVMTTFDKKLAHTRWLTWAFLALSVGLMVGGGLWAWEAEETRGVVLGATCFLLGGQVQVLVKLWYWQVHGRIQVQRDLHEVALQLAALREGAA